MKERRKERQKNEWVNERPNERTDGRAGGRTDGRTDGGTNERSNERRNALSVLLAPGRPVGHSAAPSATAPRRPVGHSAALATRHCGLISATAERALNFRSFSNRIAPRLAVHHRTAPHRRPQRRLATATAVSCPRLRSWDSQRWRSIETPTCLGVNEQGERVSNTCFVVIQDVLHPPSEHLRPLVPMVLEHM